MPNPGSIAGRAPNSPDDALWRAIRDLQKQMQELNTARTLDAATITAEAGHGIRTADFNGTSFAAPGTTGNYFGGDGAVLGDLFLRPGTVDNDALAAPISPVAGQNAATGFALPGTQATVCTLNIPVPAGYTRCICYGTATFSIYNPTSTKFFVQGCCYNATGGVGVGVNAQSEVDPSDMDSFAHSSSTLLSGLAAGSNVVLQAQCSVGGSGVAANANQAVNITAIGLFLR